MKTLLILFIALSSYADTLSDRIAAAKADEQTASRLANTLVSQRTAAHIDSLFQADSTLAADKVRVWGSGIDSVWVKVAIDKLSALDQKIVKAELKGTDLGFQVIGSDTLYMRRDRAEKALPVISAALK